MRVHISLFIVMAMLLAAVPGWGTVITVPGDESSIQEGVDAAADGDTVLVAPGTYFENVKIFNKNVVLASHYILEGDEQFIEGFFAQLAWNVARREERLRLAFDVDDQRPGDCRLAIAAHQMQPQRFGRGAGGVQGFLETGGALQGRP